MYALLKKYRGTIMGLSILWIMFYHCGATVSNGVLRFFKDLGYGGVDIFFVCSGFGIVHSLQKHTSMEFYQNRVKKLYPAYFLFILVYIVFQVAVVKDMDVIEMAGALSLTGWWFGYDKQFNWYVSSLLLFYLISPLLNDLLKDKKKPQKRLFLVILYALFLCMACINYGDKIMAIGRIPVFAIGMHWGLHLEKDKKVSVKNLITGLVLCIGGVVFSIFSLTLGGIFEMLGFGVPFLMIAPGACILVPWVLQYADRGIGAYLIKAVNVVGECSFEIYMIHIAIFKYALYFINDVSNLMYAGMFVVSLALGILYHKLLDLFMNWMKEKKGMKKLLKTTKVAALLAMVMVFQAGCGKKAESVDASQKVYKISTETAFAPFAYMDEAGEYVGIDLDLFAAIAEDQKINYEYQYLGFEAACASLETAQADGAICCLSIKEERKAKYDFSDPYYTSSAITLTHSNIDISSMDELKGMRVGAKMATDAENYAWDLEEQYGIEVVLLESTADALMMLQSNSVDAIIEDTSVAKAICAQDDTLMLIGDEGYKTEIGFAVPKGQNPELLAAFNKGLANLKENGKYDEIMTKYLNN